VTCINFFEKKISAKISPLTSKIGSGAAWVLKRFMRKKLDDDIMRKKLDQRGAGNMIVPRCPFFFCDYPTLGNMILYAIYRSIRQYY